MMKFIFKMAYFITEFVKISPKYVQVTQTEEQIRRNNLPVQIPYGNPEFSLANFASVQRITLRMYL